MNEKLIAKELIKIAKGLIEGKTIIADGKNCNISGCANNISGKCELTVQKTIKLLGRPKIEPNTTNCPEFVSTHGYNKGN